MGVIVKVKLQININHELLLIAIQQRYGAVNKCIKSMPVW